MIEENDGVDQEGPIFPTFSNHIQYGYIKVTCEHRYRNIL